MTPLDYRIVAFDRPHRVVLLGESDTVRSEDTVTVAPSADGGSVLTYEADLRLRGPVRALNPVLPLAFDRIGDQRRGRTAPGARGSARPDRAAPGRGGSGRAPSTRGLEATVVGSFSSIGPVLRSRTAGWTPAALGWPGAPSWSPGPPRASGWPPPPGSPAWVPRWSSRPGATSAPSGPRARCARRSRPPTSPTCWPTWASSTRCGRWPTHFLATHDRLDVLVHNAGALTKDAPVTGSGTELTVASQVAAPYLLTGLLLAALGAGAPSRVIQVSSGGMYTQRFDLATLEMGPDELRRHRGLRQGQAGPAGPAARVGAAHGRVRASSFHAMHPGWADTPGIRRSLPGFSKVDGPAAAHARTGRRHRGVAGRRTGRRASRTAASGWTAGAGGSTRYPGPGCPRPDFRRRRRRTCGRGAPAHRLGRPVRPA